MLKPSQFGLNEANFPDITFGSLFEENTFIAKNKFEAKFTNKINFLNYANIKQIDLKTFYLVMGTPKTLTSLKCHHTLYPQSLYSLIPKLKDH